MRIEIIEDETIDDDTVVVYCKKITPEIEKLYEVLGNDTIGVIHRGSEVMMPLSEILFFETSEDAVYAHTKVHSFKCNYRLYELEDILPSNFTRISKSTITNINTIQSIERKLTSSRAIEYRESNKVSYVSRMYYPSIKDKLSERRIG